MYNDNYYINVCDMIIYNPCILDFTVATHNNIIVIMIIIIIIVAPHAVFIRISRLQLYNI